MDTSLEQDERHGDERNRRPAVRPSRFRARARCVARRMVLCAGRGRAGRARLSVDRARPARARHQRPLSRVVSRTPARQGRVRRGAVAGREHHARRLRDPGAAGRRRRVCARPRQGRSGRAQHGWPRDHGRRGTRAGEDREARLSRGVHARVGGARPRLRACAGEPRRHARRADAGEPARDRRAADRSAQWRCGLSRAVETGAVRRRAASRFRRSREPDDLRRAGRAVATAIPTSAARWGAIDRHYIKCLADRVLLPALQQRFIDEADAFAPDNPTHVHQLDSSHSPFMSQPAVLAGVLADIAKS